MLNLHNYINCLEICEKSDGLFYESKLSIEGYNISIFNYRLSTYNDFVTYGAFELRGLTFVFNLDGSVYKRFLLMEKFFNINENVSTLFDVVKDKKVNSVYLKEDGSIINFIELPNGKIVAKSKMSFESEQALMAQDLFESNANINKFVKDCISKDLVPIFEYVGPMNRVVVKYDNSDLILLRLRDNKTGNYLSIDGYDDVSKPMSFKFTLSDLMNLKGNLEGIEGWIVEFVDGQKVKIKTDWYFSLHKIFTDYSNREDYLIDMILDEKIDDVLSVLDYGSENRKFVELVLDTTNRKVMDISNEIDKVLSTYNGDRKAFALEYNNHKLFGIMMQVISGKDKMEVIKSSIKKITYRLSGAREWLNL
jgi:T4 RnlA family RNA ligase